ncbi:lytic polysaccharide monooxygenase [Cucurbitaria berberidis CBS 394.84]|uniref:lytic cellulose monooxygenase (C4-dehydrogenating) n=1 Tax=Cucurbitaria berberidis CBS 394.84 TaxID=1168544 RepID=A0A9P4LA35_9PLEO|nr:lytic polysaccharide monooxygenase [Cucurbitaria berberidis CBS 394.84]KAF1846998.1 lytic polysaccharide monooxygenase [Cucurbitaria berberidis CBS 394.84]
MICLASKFAFLLLGASSALAHWNYDRIIVNGELIGSSYQYIRKTNNSNEPLQNVNSTDMRCNAGASSGVALGTQTYTVAAGDMLGFAVKDTFGHPGPQQVYISKSPGPAAEYDGSGDWAKIYSLTYSLNASSGGSDGLLKWATHRARTFNFKLPAETPPGEYLLRAEGLALHAAHKPDKAQFYIACAQINVTGTAAKGSPGPTIRFPGGYQWNSTGVLIPEFWSRITNYTAAGPKLWPEGTLEAHVLDGTKKTGAD